MALSAYRKKRDFSNTPEPAPRRAAAKTKKFRFVVQRHDASRLHYDFRLELGGVLKSWAVPKGPSMNPHDRRLAVMVEDHPVSYIGFEGVIPKGNYGAGTVEIWDQGHYFPVNEEMDTLSERAALRALESGELKFFLKGRKLEGGFVLVRMNTDENNWLLIKHRDEWAVTRKYESERYRKPQPSKTRPGKKIQKKKLHAGR
ncbi:MAG TPA: DNA polymerase ligase N-terminal domain-containing protein [Chitinophagaceae bacterium]|nr:DNA polymerase ligase N-terminal domain-containing protein [Chitinophagaceae bacterium]